jgi:hypothetical protein
MASVPILEASYRAPKIGAMQKSIFTDEYIALRKRLTELRTKAGLTQRDVARALGVPHSWIAKVESGERRIDLVEFGWFCEACGSSPTKQACALFETWKRRHGGRSR